MNLAMLFTFENINFIKSCSKKECCKQCRHVKFKGTMTKWPVQKQTHITAQKQAESQCFYFYFLFMIFGRFLQEMLSYRLGTVNYFHWGFKPVLSYSKPHTFSTLFWEENKCAFTHSNQASYTMNRTIGKWKEV